jgi:hypothetical protein
VFPPETFLRDLSKIFFSTKNHTKKKNFDCIYVPLDYFTSLRKKANAEIIEWTSARVPPTPPSVETTLAGLIEGWQTAGLNAKKKLLMGPWCLGLPVS